MRCQFCTAEAHYLAYPCCKACWAERCMFNEDGTPKAERQHQQSRARRKGQ